MSDDEAPQLSAETFGALMEFYKEQEERENYQKLIGSDIIPEGNVPFSENWQLSQFWYDDETMHILADVAYKVVGPCSKIALVSCPSLYKRIKHIAHNCEITLFEHDKRFAAYGLDFMFYDYKAPLSIPRDKSRCYDIVIADPPFLSEECLTKMAVTIKYLAKSNIILCTGAVMADLVQRLLDLRKCSFEPKHKNNLANEFWCYANFDMDALL